MRSILFFVVALLCFTACKEELVVIPVLESVESPRVILLEELTGVSCPNCPVGTEKIKELKNTYGDNLVVVAVHGSFLSWPTDESKYDFRFPEAAELENYLRPWQGKPAASINRILHTEDELSISNPQIWGKYVKEELEAEHRMNVDLSVEYDESTRTATINTSLLPVSDFGLEEELKLTVMILESEIEDAQENTTEIIEEYTHDHVLRAFATDWKGESIQKELKDNVEEKFQHTFVIPEAEEGQELWRPEHMEVVAFIHSDVGGAKKVFQAAEAKIKE